MADEGQGQEKEADKKIHSDMNEEMRIEAIELSMTACEKYSTNYEQAARVIKETMDKKFGIYWHVVVGEGFGFEARLQSGVQLISKIFGRILRSLPSSVLQSSSIISAAYKALDCKQAAIPHGGGDFVAHSNISYNI
uniref:Dynein light chain n=1 Tax=Glossina austeni TaxID=7395 RepID=A0A1A9V8H4_GLOAU